MQNLNSVSKQSVQQLPANKTDKDEFIEKIRRKARDALNKTADSKVIVKIASLLKVI